MINMVVTTTGFDAILAKLQLLAAPNLLPLLLDIEGILRRGTRRDREMAVGANGPFDPVLESTEKRRARAGRGDGPALFPDERSRFAELETTIQQFTPEHGIVIGGWPGTEAFLVHHMNGTPIMTRRDPVFISFETWEEVRTAIRVFYENLLARGADTGSVPTFSGFGSGVGGGV